MSTPNETARELIEMAIKRVDINNQTVGATRAQIEKLRGYAAGAPGLVIGAEMRDHANHHLAPLADILEQNTAFIRQLQGFIAEHITSSKSVDLTLATIADGVAHAHHASSAQEIAALAHEIYEAL